MIASDVVAKRPRVLDPGIRLQGGEKGLPIAGAIWTDRALFVLLRLERSVKRPALNVKLEYREPLIFPTGPSPIHLMPPYTGEHSRSSLSRPLFLPRQLPAGDWLFSLRISKLHVRGVQLRPFIGAVTNTDR
jgi:hypothetical protein